MASTTPTPIDVPICERINHYTEGNKTLIIEGYEGIPHNLLINFISWLVLIVIFSYLRKFSWGHGKLALVSRPNKRLISQFFGNVDQHLAFTDLENSKSSRVRTCEIEDALSSDRYETRDKHAWDWILKIFKLRNQDYEQKVGLDAVHYLRFHLYLLIYTGIMMSICLILILPLNIHGVLKSPDYSQFGVTTISNIAGDSPHLWCHVLMGFAFFALAFFMMAHFANRLRAEIRFSSPVLDDTLMISGISRSHCQVERIKKHFEEAYPTCQLSSVHMAYDVNKLFSIDKKLCNAANALDYCQTKLECEGVRLRVIPRCCGQSCLRTRQICCSCCNPDLSTNNDQVIADNMMESIQEDTNLLNSSEVGWCSCASKTKSVDAINFYSLEVSRLTRALIDERTRALESKVGIAFIVFKSAQDAKTVYDNFRLTNWSYKRFANTTESSNLRSWRWVVQYSPVPNTIIWENLSLKRTFWWIKAIFLNLAVMLIAFFITTPTYALNLINKLEVPDRLMITNPLILNFFPSLILLGASVLLPCMVYYSDWLLGHWTKTTMHFLIMSKTFTMLLLMVLILPSLGLTSISALLQWIFPLSPLKPINPPSTPSPEIGTAVNKLEPIIVPSFRWQCVFMPQNGAYFVNYIITSSLIGSALDLMRFPQLILYLFKLMMSISEAEIDSVKKNVLVEFDFGLNYAWLLCVFAVITAYSVLCPLIMPFGFLFMVLKYIVARYNLYYAYAPSRIDARLHWLASSLMLSCVLMLQLNIIMFIGLRFELASEALSITTFGLFVVCLIWFVAAIFLGWVYFQPSVAKVSDSISPVHCPVSDSPGDNTTSSALDEPSDLLIPETPNIQKPFSHLEPVNDHGFTPLVVQGSRPKYTE